MRAVPTDESPRATCVFCQIVDGRETASVVYLDAGVIAFMDLRPINAGHLLVVPCEGVNLFVPDGEVAGQEVMHIHLHVLPRTPGDGFRIERGSAITGRAELDQAAALVRGGLDRAD
jgi:diadenosine tetraphosphate (Ap4A) HIT family hydrolase